MAKGKKSGPGRSDRDGLSVFELTEMFPNEEAATEWFEVMIWADGRHCPKCGSERTYRVPSGKPQPFRCSACRKYFSVRTGTVMRSSKLSLKIWLVAIYMVATSLKGVSAMRLHRSFKIKYESAWHLAHRIREAWNTAFTEFTGEVEIDETFIGGKEKNKHAHKKLKAGRGTVGKAVVLGIRERDSRRVQVVHVPGTDAATLLPFIEEAVEAGATIYTDEHSAYRTLRKTYIHKSVKHGAKEFVRERISTNGIESFWSSFKRGYHGTFHWMSLKHLQRYINEFAGRHNIRDYDTLDQMALITRALVGKHLPLKQLVA